MPTKREKDPKSQRSKEQTWKEHELQESIKEIADQRKQRDKPAGSSSRDRDHGDDRRQKDGKHRESKDRDRHRDDRDRDRHRDEKDRGKHRDDRDRDRHRDEKDRDRHRDEKDRDRHRDEKDRDRHRDEKDRDRHRDDRDRDRRRDDKDRDRHRDEKDRDRHRDEKDRDRHRDEKDRDRHRDEKDRDRHRDDRDRDRRRDDKDRDRHRDDRDRDRRRDDKDRDRHRDEKDRDRHRDEKDRDRHRDEKDRDRHRDEKDRDKHRDEKDRDRHRDEKDRGKHRDEKDRGKHRDDKEKEKHRGDKHREERDRHKDDKGRERLRGDKDRERSKGDRERQREDRDRNKEDASKHKGDRERGKHRDDGGRDSKDNHRDDQVTSRSKRADEDVSRDAGRGSRHKDDMQEEVPDEVLRDDKNKNDVEAVSNNPSEMKKEDDEDDYGDYEEDFEDYDDDFEDDDDGGEEDEDGGQVKKMSNSEMEELFDALNKENERLLAESTKSTWSDSTDDERPQVTKRPTTSKPRSFINFVAANQRDLSQKAASKARRRCTELLKIIDLDTVYIPLFDLPPVKEYDLYMSSFGRTNAQQVYIQTNEDNLDRDIQTEDIELCDKWSQHPPETAVVCGSGEGDQDSHDPLDLSKHDESRLTAFVQRAGQVIERLIEEEHSKSIYSQGGSSFSCSEGFIELRNVELFKSRLVVGSHYSSTDTNMLLTIHSKPSQDVVKRLDRFGLIGVWNINNPHQPYKVVASANMPTCCCFSPVKAALVFAGMQDGSLVAWDLREPPTMHHSYICGSKDWLLRFPTYNTAGVLKYESHTSPVSALVPIVTSNNKSAIQDSGIGLSFQLASLDRSGLINLWVVTEILETSVAGSESDLGLSPNGKIKLLKSSAILLESPSKSIATSTMCTLDMQLNPTNPNHFYVSNDSGEVLHGTRFGHQNAVPRSYAPRTASLCPVTSIDVHPLGHPVILVGYDNGSVSLFHLTSESPILTWDSFTNGAAIQKVLWSKNCSYIIFVLDGNSVIHMWDLLRNDTEPMTSDQILHDNHKVNSIDLSTEYQSNARPKMTICFEDGTVQIHKLSSHVRNLQPGENDQFARFVDQL